MKANEFNMIRILALFMVINLWGCGRQSKEDKLSSEMKAFYGKKILFTDNLFRNKGDDSLAMNPIQHIPYKIVAYIDSVGCTPCALEKLTLWEKYIPRLEQWNVSLLFIVRNSNIGEVEQVVQEFRIPFPIFFDPGGLFETTNRLPANPLFRIFLLNQDNQVIFIGAPIQNEKSWTLFEKTMQRLIANKNQLPGLIKQ